MIKKNCFCMISIALSLFTYFNDSLVMRSTKSDVWMSYSVNSRRNYISKITENSFLAANFSLMVGLESSEADDGFGVENDLLSLCPETPTCVSSQDDRPSYFSEPWTYDVSTEKAKDMILGYLYSHGMKIISKTDRYIRSELTSFNGFYTDDMEFYLTPSDYTVQFRVNRRSAGTDFGENRKRMEKMRIALGFEKLPVLRNRKRLFIFGESPLDSFGPSGYYNEVPETMNKGTLYGESDPNAPMFESQSFGNKLSKWWSRIQSEADYVDQ